MVLKKEKDHARTCFWQAVRASWDQRCCGDEHFESHGHERAFRPCDAWWHRFDAGCALQQRFSEGNAISFNRYAYGNNNPYRFTDLTGQWATDIHQQYIRSVLGSLPEHDVSIMVQQQSVIDAFAVQTNDNQYKHALTTFDQTSEQARTAANKFVFDELVTARILSMVGDRDAALEHVGNAIHTMQDATSPSHRNFQIWDTRMSPMGMLEHLMVEALPPLPESQEDRELATATKRGWDIFSGTGAIPTAVFPSQ